VVDTGERELVVGWGGVGWGGVGRRASGEEDEGRFAEGRQPVAPEMEG
jgi:hypothetical protein